MCPRQVVEIGGGDWFNVAANFLIIFFVGFFGFSGSCVILQPIPEP